MMTVDCPPDSRNKILSQIQAFGMQVGVSGSAKRLQYLIALFGVRWQ